VAERLAAALAVAAALLALSACGLGDGGDASDPASTTTATVTTTAEPTARERFFGALGEQLREGGISADQARCITAKLEARMTPKELAQIDRSEVPKTLPRRSAAAGAACGSEALAGIGQ
jgi:hypothetical protein